MPATICTYPGCGARIAEGPRCPKHPIARPADRRKSAARRGYDDRWRKVREAYLVRHPMCEIQQKCDGAPATMVDHKIPIEAAPSLRLRWSNLQAACHACNTWKGRVIDPQIIAERTSGKNPVT